MCDILSVVGFLENFYLLIFYPGFLLDVCGDLINLDDMSSHSLLNKLIYIE